MSPPSFPITPRELRGDWSFSGLEPSTIQLGSLRLIAREIPHTGGRTFGYRVSDGRGTIAYLPDHSPTDLGSGPDGLGVYHDAALELADGADLLLHDSFWYAGEFDAAHTLGHAAAEYAIGLAKVAGAREALLLHHRPDRTDEELDRRASRLLDSPVPTGLAADGVVLRL
jgi:phosphoribosyl 1,2-cyclic phosphodiesterase